ncbi:MAG TPA: choice-of-anchor Q domain-containing protein, partial [Gemmataceae bacterium]|nr:choice-of-anchor Q domain-containing protein [Gemmataceae bacterium]
MLNFNFGAWLRKISGKAFRQPIRWARRKDRPAARPLLELLEERMVPSTYQVVNTSDSGAGSLRQAITNANANPFSTIDFAIPSSDPGYSNGVWTITLGGTELPQITADMTITGPGAGQLAISGNNQSRVFEVNAPVVTISGLTVEAGYNSASGGGVRVDSGAALSMTGVVVQNSFASAGGGIALMSGSFGPPSLTLTNSTISGNTGNTGGGGGIAVYSGTLTVNGSTISGNTGHGFNGGGGISANSGSVTITISDSTISGNTFSNSPNNFGGGGIASGGKLTITNSTIAGNTASVAGGAIENFGSGKLVITDSTISGNTAASSGGGIRNENNYGGELTLDNTIVAANSAPSRPDILGSVTTDKGYNLIGDGSNVSGLTGTGDLIGTDASRINPLLWALGDYGGSAQSRPLEIGSPAIGAGDPGQAGTADQRGTVRGSPVDIGAVQGALFVVNTTADSDDGSATGATVSLRDAIRYGVNASPGTNIIRFDPTVFIVGNGPYTITLSGSELPQITGEVQINGIGASNLAVSGDNQSRVFDVAGGATAAVSGLTIEDGYGQSGTNGGYNDCGGGALVYPGGTLTLTDSTVTGNSSQSYGGAIANYGTLILTDSTVSNNSTGGGGGGIQSFPGTTTLEVFDSTISGNSAGNLGGGIAVYGDASLVDTTISGNTAPVGGGIDNSSGAILTLTNTIIAANTATGSGPDIANGGSITDGGYNLIGVGDGTGFVNGVNHDHVGTSGNPLDPLLAPLGYYAGPTETLAPLPGSPALGAGDPGQAGTTAQNGIVRVAGGVDIGAVEDPRLVVTTTADGGAGSLRDAIASADAAPGTSVITFDPGLSGRTITLYGTELPQITADVEIDGLGASQLTVSGNSQSRVFDVASGVIVVLSDLTIEDGQAPGSGNLVGLSGGGVDNEGTLTLVDSTVTGSRASFGAGVGNFGTLYLLDSTLTGNTAVYFGAGLLNYGTAAVLDSTITANSATPGGAASAKGGGVFNSVFFNKQLTLQNSIVSGNTAEDSATNDIYGSITADDGYNLLGTALRGSTSGTGDVFSDSPGLGSLGDNGGPTPTMAPLPGSPAFGAGDPGQAGTTAQNDVVRITGAVDIGAAEDPRFIVNTTADSDDGSASGATVSLRDAIEYGADASQGVSFIAFDPTVFNPGNGPYTITLSGSELPQITGEVQIDGIGASNLAVSGNSASRIFDVGVGTTVAISGLTIEDGYAGAGNGGAVTNAGTLTLADSTVTGSTANSGGGIYNTGTLRLYSGIVSDNTTSGSGGGIYNTGSLYVLNQSVITGNTSSGSGGGIANSAALKITDSTVSYNTAANAGGGIYNTSALYLYGSTVSHNSAANGGGIDNLGATHVLDHSVITGNTTTGSGGGIYNTRNNLYVVNSTISDNTADVNGGGVSNARFGTVVLTDSTVSGNQAPSGGGLYNAIYGTTSLYGSTVSSNTAMNGLGGGIQNAGNLYLYSYSTVSGNYAYGDGGGIANTDRLTVADSTISDNTTRYSGGGVYNASLDTAVLTGSTVSGNKSLGYGYATGGGGIANAGYLHLTASTVSSNYANRYYQGGLGGGVQNLFNLYVTDSTIANNTAYGYGGAIYNNGAATAVVTDSTLSGNTANGSGGGVDNYDGSLSLENSILSGNTAGGGNAPSNLVGPGTLTDLGYNLLGTDVSATVTGDVSSDQPLLSALGNYGGPTETMALLPGSPAIGVGSPSGVVDQRGKPIDSTGTGDIGAFQSQRFTIQISGDSTVYPVIGGLPATMTVQVFANNAVEPVAGGVVFFTVTSGTGAVVTGSPATIDANRNAAATAAAAAGSQPGDETMINATTTGANNSVTFTAYDAAGGNPLQVTTTADGGDGSLRAAITYADNNGGGTITFAIPRTDPGYDGTAFTIHPQSALPDVGDDVTIDGTSEASYLSATYTSPIIVLSGDQAGSNVTGLELTGSASTIQGLVVNQFTYDGIDINGGSQNVIQGDYIGLDATGTTAGPGESLGNSYDVVIEGGASDNTIGGVTAAARNVISGSSQAFGVLIYGSGTTGNVVEGDYIGTDATGMTSTDGSGNPLGNDEGVRIEYASDNTIGGTTAAARNIISGNSEDGVDIGLAGTTDNVVEGNYIGTDVTGAVKLGTGDWGVIIGQSGSSADGNTIGGTTVGAGNVIVGSLIAAVEIDGASSNAVQGNIIGLNAGGTGVLGNSGSGVLLTQGATDNTIGGAASSAVTTIASAPPSAFTGPLTQAADGFLYALDAAGDVIRIDPTTGAQTSVTTVAGATNLAVDPSVADSLVVTAVSGGTASLVRVNTSNGAQTVLTSGGYLVNPTAVAYDPSTGDYLITDPNSTAGPAVIAWTAAGGQTVFTSGSYPFALGDPVAVAVSPTGAVLVLDNAAVLNGSPTPLI